MLRKENVDPYASFRPFRSFEIRRIDGQRSRFRRIEEFRVARSHLVTLNRKAETVFIRIGLISTIGPVARPNRRRPRNADGL